MIVKLHRFIVQKRKTKIDKRTDECIHGVPTSQISARQTSVPGTLTNRKGEDRSDQGGIGNTCLVGRLPLATAMGTGGTSANGRADRGMAAMTDPERRDQ